MTRDLNWLTAEKFEAFKRGYLRGIRWELGRLASRERHRRGDLENLDLEYKFGEIRRLLKSGADQPRNASYLSDQFKTEEMRVIYALLDDIVEEVERNSDRRAIREGYESVRRHITDFGMLTRSRTP